MESFYINRENETLGPLTAGEVRAARVRPNELLRYGEEGPWLHLSTLISTNAEAREDLDEALDPDEPGPEPWERRNLAEWTWPAMLLGADALWFVTAARINDTAAGWGTALLLVGIMAFCVAGLLQRRPWAWNLAALITAASSAWLLAPLIAAPSAGLALWSSINLLAALLLFFRRPRGAALDWSREHRRLLLVLAENPATEALPFRFRTDRAGPWHALIGVLVFFVIVLGGVYVYHRVRYPELSIPISLIPRGTDLLGRLARLSVYALMVTMAVVLARRGGSALLGLGITIGQGWKRAAWTGFRLFLVLSVVLLGGRWLLRTVEVIEERIAQPADPDTPDAPGSSTVAEVRTTVQDVLERTAQRSIFSLPQLWALLVALLLGPLCEEIFFRGLLFGSLRRQWPFWAAAGLSTLIFAVAHGPIAGWSLATVLFWLEIGAGGLIAAYAYELTGTLVAPLVMHVLFNAAQTATGMAPLG